eukprot:CAMPEP_0198546336 /NCGR_PEP_ID=MMETSP1462-20131121/66957_1 /TAXON_ID=1333877 /ORGANISM="Brandtodinium nutriculum, Strain RCC3387" /LENGTH=74 /DNA_ID=CAMNT_0044276773 /DNA_START=41 /DNA_END=261 /DNA_ORIENTATION=+
MCCEQRHAGEPQTHNCWGGLIERAAETDKPELQGKERANPHGKHEGTKAVLKLDPNKNLNASCAQAGLIAVCAG